MSDTSASRPTPHNVAGGPGVPLQATTIAALAELRQGADRVLREARHALQSLSPSAEELEAMIAAVVRVREELEAAYGGGMAHMPAAMRRQYDQLCLVHDQLRRHRAGSGAHVVSQLL